MAVSGVAMRKSSRCVIQGLPRVVGKVNHVKRATGGDFETVIIALEYETEGPCAVFEIVLVDVDPPASCVEGARLTASGAVIYATQDTAQEVPKLVEPSDLSCQPN